MKKGKLMSRKVSVTRQKKNNGLEKKVIGSE